MAQAAHDIRPELPFLKKWILLTIPPLLQQGEIVNKVQNSYMLNCSIISL